MEKVKSICVMRELSLAMSKLEAELVANYGVGFNEAMLLCCIGTDTLTASQISEATGMAPSHTSKIIRTIERKGLVIRAMGENDKRQMRFTLSPAGAGCLNRIKTEEIEIPEYIRPLFDAD